MQCEGELGTSRGGGGVGRIRFSRLSSASHAKLWAAKSCCYFYGGGAGAVLLLRRDVGVA
jgi:hypothetical protein